MAARLHLTIGEVLSLLREEFPDVSISKIRFLESQGLVDPERTPSGYRKFYEQDVERLRWILLQQKEHFLPLKVIRDRLDTDGSEDVDLLDEAPAPLVAPAAAGAPPSALDATPADSRPAVASAPADSRPAVASAPAARPSPPVESPPVAPPVAPPPVAAADPVAPRLPAVTRPRPEPSRPAEREAVQPTPAGARARGGRSGGGGSPAVADRRTAAEQIRARDSDDGREGAVPEVWTSTELAEALGSTLSLVRELEQYGIVRPAATVGGVGYFDGHGLALARIGCRLAELGVEPRHLRPWRNSADREVGLFEQLVLPLLRQRSDDARQDGADRLAELVALGGELRSGLVAEALRALG